MARTRKNNATATPAAHANGAQPNETKGIIFAAIRDGWNTIAGNAADVETAHNAWLAAAETGRATRADVLRSLASKAHDGNWQMPLIEAALADLKAQLNTGAKNIANFEREVKNVCHPKVRMQVGTIYAMADQAFNADQLESDDAADKPMKAAFARRDNFVQQVIAGAIKDKPVPTSRNACIEMAQQRLEGDAKWKRLAGQVKRASEALAEVNAALGGNGLDLLASAIKSLAGVDAARLKTTAETVAGIAANDVHTAPKSARAKAPAQVIDVTPTAVTVEPMPGITDIDTLIAGVRAMPDNAIAALIAKASGK